MSSKFWLIALLLSSSFLAGCQSTPKSPDWYAKPQQSDNQYLYAVGRGRSLSQAKKVAINQINEQLWTQVQSQNSQREIYRESNGVDNYQNLVDAKIQTKSARLTLTGVEYPQVENSDLGYYVQARVKRDVVSEQLKRELKEINQAADNEIAKLKHSDMLVWFLTNRNASQKKEDALIRIAVLSALNPGASFSTDGIDRLLSKVSKVKDSLLIKVVSEPSDKKMTSFISDVLSQENIDSTQSKYNKKATHTIKLALDKRKSKVGGAYITTIISSVSTLNQKGKTIASSEVIASGNSVSNYKMSAEGAARHFKAQLNEKGLWTSLGFNL